ncbi:MAG: VTT domain-containing protein [Pseudomonadota bacterium]|nr:VTT domain-containing protein [Pseudomonadota bacterium]
MSHSPHFDRRKIIGSTLAAGVVLLSLFLIWRWTPLADRLSVDQLIIWAQLVKQSPFAFLLVVLIYVLGCIVVFPLSLLIIATAVAFGFWKGVAFAYAGSLVGAAVNYEMGRYLGYDTMRAFTGTRLDRVNRFLSHRGVLTMVIVDIFPVAPFSLTNMAAGASHMSFRDYMVGSAIGLIPGILLIALFGGRLQSFMREPNWWDVAGMVAVVGVVIGALLMMRQRIARLADRWEREAQDDSIDYR